VRWVKTLLLLLIFLVVLFFSFQNQDLVTIRFVLLPIENYHGFEIPKVSIPLFLVVLCSIFLGVLIGGMGDFYRRVQLKKTLRQSQKAIERLEREIQSLRGSGLDQTSFLKKEG
jgi:uncharacterized integral membrane protein